MFPNLKVILFFVMIASTHAKPGPKCSHALRSSKPLYKLFDLVQSWGTKDLKFGDDLDLKECPGGIPGCHRAICYDKETGNAIFLVKACQDRGGGCGTHFDGICDEANGFMRCTTCDPSLLKDFALCTIDFLSDFDTPYGLPPPLPLSTPIALKKTTTVTFAHHTFQFGSVTTENGAGGPASLAYFLVVATLLCVAFIRWEMFV